METDPISGVRLLGEPVPYLDGAEEAMRQVLEGPIDRSTGSDELAARINDWPSRYHLSRLRANLLRPLRLGPGARVLDVGAGTGPLARYAGEQGADVVALEGSLPRARVAAARCEGLDRVEVVCGRPEQLDDGDFDVVVVCGVLEYAAATTGGSGSPEAFLRRVRDLTRSGGAVVLAIENQLGLKYLLGWPEDHLSEPWVGLDDYPAGPGARTYSRRELAALLRDAGFPEQRWLFPFPDYKLPSVVLDEGAYEEPDAEVFVDGLVRRPSADTPLPRAAVCDDRRAHRVFVRAGLGPEVANSFLVVASADAGVPTTLVDPDVLAWRFGGERLRVWQRQKIVRRTADGRSVTGSPLADTGEVRERGWLTQDPSSEQVYALGPTAEQLALDACAAHDREALAEVLTRWRSHLLEREEDKIVGAGHAHPLLPEGTRAVLPTPYVDVDLGNFVSGADGSLVYIDTEWLVPDGVSTDLVSFRALWYFAEALVTSGAEHPWPIAVTVDEMTETLARMCDVPADPESLGAWRHAESELQAKVLGTSSAGMLENFTTAGAASRLTADVSHRLPFTRLRRDVARLQADNELLRPRSDRLEEHLDHHRQVVAELSAQIAALETEKAEVGGALAAVQSEVAALVTQRDRMERRLPVRLYRRLRRFVDPA